MVKTKFEIPSIDIIKSDICSKEAIDQRYSENEPSDAEMDDINHQLMSSISYETWNKVADWGKDSGCLSLQDQNIARNIAHKAKYDYKLNKRDIARGIVIYEIVCRNNYDIFEMEITKGTKDNSISNEYVIKMLTWEKAPVVLEDWQFKILQQSIKNNYISHFRASELISIRKQLHNHGFQE